MGVTMKVRTSELKIKKEAHKFIETLNEKEEEGSTESAKQNKEKSGEQAKWL